MKLPLAALTILAALSLPAPGAAQRLASSFPVAAEPLAGAHQPFAVDARAYPRTYWLEGGIIGGVGMGVFAVLLFQGISESPATLPRIAAAGVIGAAVGFPVGALIGSTIRKPDQ